MLSSRQEELAFLGVGIVIFGAVVELAAVGRFIHYKVTISSGVFTSSAMVYLLVALGLVLLSIGYIIFVVIG